MLLDIATSLPPYRVSQQTAYAELKKRMTAEKPAAARILDAAISHSGIESRNVIVLEGDDTPDQFLFGDNSNPTTKERMKRYEEASRTLSCQAVAALLNNTGIAAEQINRLITVSCTGFYAPGPDYHLIKQFDMPRSIQRTNIGFMGCAASITGFTSVLEALSRTKERSAILLVSVELCSLHIQFEPTRDNLLSNTIFSDGCAAALFTNDPGRRGRLKLIDTVTVLFDNSSELMGWKIGDSGFEMRLSSEIPKLIVSAAAPALKNILKDKGIDKIKYWALHPGGRAILDALQQGLELSDEQMKYSRSVLRQYGNMSSASIMLVLKELLDEVRPKDDEYLCAAAFGPGLTMEVAIFRGVSGNGR